MGKGSSIETGKSWEGVGRGLVGEEEEKLSLFTFPMNLNRIDKVVVSFFWGEEKWETLWIFNRKR